MDHKTLRALALLGAVTGANFVTGGAAAAAPHRWECRDEQLPGPVFGESHCEYSQFPLRAPNLPPQVNPGPQPGPGPSPGPYSS